MKHKLKIPNVIPKDRIETAYHLKPLDGYTIQIDNGEDDFYWIKINHANYTVPKSWIKLDGDCPISAEEYAESSLGGSPEKEVMRLKKVWEIEAFKAGESNDRKRTQPAIECLRDILNHPIVHWLEVKIKNTLKSINENER